ncbi:MAG: GT2 family glycosyltransferase [Cyclobacteriaceae bacterium]|jgi:GT2 family glycosyltransferase
MPKYSIIVPVFKREDEIKELLDSLALLTTQNFEIIIVDGSPADDLIAVNTYVNSQLPDLAYQRLYSKGLGISDSRNLGADHAKGEYLIFMDSDVIVPKDYFDELDHALERFGYDAFGGPDAAHESFSAIQKAISFSMTSMLTTGGIRGKEGHVGKFKPRGFNMGMKAEIFKVLGGYNALLPVGEDMDLSARIVAEGYKTGLVSRAFVYHKRRVSISKFYKQVFRFGAARVMLSQMHRDELKVTHLFPLFFVIYLLGGIVSLWCPEPLVRIWPISIGVYFLLLYRGAAIESGSVKVGLLSVPVTITQFAGYAIGFLKNGMAVWILRKPNGIFSKKEGEPDSPI